MFVRSKLADPANQFYIDKKKILASSFQDKTRDPISILSKLIPRKNEGNKFLLKAFQNLQYYETFKEVEDERKERNVGQKTCLKAVLRTARHSVSYWVKCQDKNKLLGNMG